MTTSATPAWNSHSPFQSPQAQPVTPSRPKPGRLPASYSSHHNTSPMPPLLSQERRTPAGSHPPGGSDASGASPNYFSLALDPDKDRFTTSAANRVRANWGSASSNIRSQAASSPRIVSPAQQKTDTAASEPHLEPSPFSFGGLADTDVIKSQSPRRMRESAGSAVSSPVPIPSGVVSGNVGMGSPGSSRNASIAAREAISLQIPRSPKRMLSDDSVSAAGRIRRDSPASFTDESSTRPDMSSRRSASNHKHLAMLDSIGSARADTLPGSTSSPVDEGPVLVSPQHVVGLMKQGAEDFLLLDVRVVTQYAKSRISGALNLCIPTTLLKRPTFNVQKLADTFKDSEQRRKFERWQNARRIVVYDEKSSQMKDATTSINTLKKFQREGWKGHSYIIRGGFEAFSASFPALVVAGGDDNKSGNSMPSVTIVSPGPSSETAVIGGCPMPPTRTAANPFFGNIRQNMDLIGGVGQIPVKHPASLTSMMESQLPPWLRKAVDEKNEGQLVSEKFLQIEKGEQSRMQEALSGNVVYSGSRSGSGAAPEDAESSIQIAGIEKGSKNRYNNIWPYEHSRVRLQGVPSSGCDYFNANFVYSSFSPKRYIATQGPMPSTFNDFWNVVWQQDVRVIVMLTAEKEGGLLKAHNYWTSARYGHLELNFLSEHRASLEPAKILRHRDSRHPSGNNANNAAIHQRSQTLAARPQKETNPPPSARSPKPAPSSKKGAADGAKNIEMDDADTPFVTVRKFTLSNAREPFSRMREITQLQYSSWPDFGAPAHPAHLLGLVEQCDTVVRSSSGRSPTPAPDSEPDGDVYSRPVVVHCSAGCGRTGTFCTVDSVVDALRRQRARRLEQERKAIRDRQDRGTSFSMDWTMSDAALASASPSSARTAPYSTPSSAVTSPAAERKRSLAYSYTTTPRTPPPSFPPTARAADPFSKFDPFSSSATSSSPSSISPQGPTSLDAMMTTPTPQPAVNFGGGPVQKGAAAAAAAGGGDLDDWLERDDVDLVERTVQDFRLQRLSMVQSLRQFVLCYESVLEWLVVQTPRTA